MSVDLLLKAVDYVVKLSERREKRGRDRLALVFDPMFAGLQRINDDYVRMFETLRASLPTALERHKDRYRIDVIDACRQLRELRVALAGTREEVAAMGADLAMRDDLDEHERQFLRAVVAYLPLGTDIGASQGPGQHRAGTRATALEAALYSGSLELEGSDVAALITRTLQENSRLWTEVCTRFGRLRVEASG